MNHQLINTGAGWRCLRCKVAWDQGEDTSGDCAAGDEYRFDASDDLHDEPIPILESGDASRWTDNFAALRHAFNDGRIRGKVGRFRTGGTVSDATMARPPDLPGERVVSKPDAMSAQVGGQHYKNLAIQPTEFCQRNGLDFCIGSILKYLTRYRSKNGIEDLRKARHFIEIRESFPYDIQPPRQIAITMLEYVTRNNVRPDDAEALYRLEAYYNAMGQQRLGARRLIEEIDRLIDRAA